MGKKAEDVKEPRCAENIIEPFLRNIPARMNKDPFHQDDDLDP